MRRFIFIIIFVMVLSTLSSLLLGGGYVDSIIIVIDYKSLGYSSPPLVVAGLTIPGVASYTPRVEVGQVLRLHFDGVGTGFEELDWLYRSGETRAIPSISLALIDYAGGGIRVRQLVITPKALALLRGGGPEALEEVGRDPLSVYRKRLGTLLVYVDRWSMKTIGDGGLSVEFTIPRGFTDLVDTRPSYKAVDTLDEPIRIPGCVVRDGLIAYHNPHTSRSAYRVIDRGSPFHGFLVNRSIPGFWRGHVQGDPGPSWLGLLEGVYTAVYMIEYKQGDDVDVLLDSMVPGVNEYVRRIIGGAVDGRPVEDVSPAGGYLLYDTMERWISGGAGSWIDTREISGISRIYSVNTTILEAVFDDSSYSGDPNIVYFIGVIRGYSGSPYREGIAGYGVAGIYTSAASIYRRLSSVAPFSILPGHSTYIYGDVIFHLGSDVGVVLYDFLGVGVDECNDTWLVVEPQFLFYVDVVPEIISLYEGDQRPTSNLEFLEGYLADYTYYRMVYTPEDFNNYSDLLKEWSASKIRGLNSAYYLGAPPLLEPVVLLLGQDTGPLAKHFIDMMGMMTNIVYEAYNTWKVGLYLSIALHDSYNKPAKPTLIEWRKPTNQFFYHTQRNPELLPLIGSRVELELSDYK